SVTQEVRRNNCIFSVTQDTLQFAFGSFFHCSADFSVSSRFSQVDSQVNYRYVQSRNTHRHTGQFTVQRRDNFTYSLSSTGRRRDDVAGSSAAADPVFHRRTVNCFLSSCCRVNRSHQTVCDTELVVQYLSDRSQTVSRTRSVRYELSTFNVCFF